MSRILSAAPRTQGSRLVGAGAGAGGAGGCPPCPRRRPARRSLPGEGRGRRRGLLYMVVTPTPATRPAGSMVQYSPSGGCGCDFPPVPPSGRRWYRRGWAQEGAVADGHFQGVDPAVGGRAVQGGERHRVAAESGKGVVPNSIPRVSAFFSQGFASRKWSSSSCRPTASRRGARHSQSAGRGHCRSP